MIIFPAIDIQDGECVRLTKGDFSTAERVADDPLQTALAFQEAGAEWIHMVDLDGAKNGQMQNREVFISVARETELKIEVGGGIRDMKTASYYLENGIERIILGSMAVRNPKLVAEMVREFGERVVVGIDAENGMVKIDGWLGAGKVNFLTLAREMAYIGVRHIIYTDISRDGTLTGPNLADLKRLRDGTGVHIIASGGISNIGDIKSLADLRLYGAICGKSLYKQTLDLKEALAVGSASIPIEPKEEVPELADLLPPVSRSAGNARGGAARPAGSASGQHASFDRGKPSGDSRMREDSPAGGKSGNRNQRPGESRPKPGGKPFRSAGEAKNREDARPGGRGKEEGRPRENNPKNNASRPSDDGRGKDGRGKSRPGSRRGEGRPGGKPYNRTSSERQQGGGKKDGNV